MFKHSATHDAAIVALLLMNMSLLHGLKLVEFLVKHLLQSAWFTRRDSARGRDDSPIADIPLTSGERATGARCAFVVSIESVSNMSSVSSAPMLKAAGHCGGALSLAPLTGRDSRATRAAASVAAWRGRLFGTFHENYEFVELNNVPVFKHLLKELKKDKKPYLANFVRSFGRTRRKHGCGLSGPSHLYLMVPYQVYKTKYWKSTCIDNFIVTFVGHTKFIIMLSAYSRTVLTRNSTGFKPC
uniref:SFRICE_021058 n=1 Tax=Spodoptera frugiperda TaxID=7108 RepID=A0A2H1VBI5_SPOFR